MGGGEGECRPGGMREGGRNGGYVGKTKRKGIKARPMKKSSLKENVDIQDSSEGRRGLKPGKGKQEVRRRTNTQGTGEVKGVEAERAARRIAGEAETLQREEERKAKEDECAEGNTTE